MSEPANIAPQSNPGEDTDLAAAIYELSAAVRRLGGPSGISAAVRGEVTKAIKTSEPAKPQQQTGGSPEWEARLRKVLEGGEKPPQWINPQTLKAETVKSGDDLRRFHEAGNKLPGHDWTAKPDVYGVHPVEGGRPVAGGPDADAGRAVRSPYDVPRLVWEIREKLNELVRREVAGRSSTGDAKVVQYQAGMAPPGEREQGKSQRRPSRLARSRLGRSKLGRFARGIGKGSGGGIGKWFRNTQVGSAISGVGKAFHRVGEAKTAGGAGLRFAGALGMTVMALNVFRKVLGEVGENQVQNMRKFAHASASIAAHMAILDMQQIFREQRLGQKLSESTGNLTRAVNRSRTASEPYVELAGDIGNAFSAALTDVWASVKEELTPVAEAARWFMLKDKKKIGEGEETATAYDYAKDFAERDAELSRQGENRLKIIRRHDSARDNTDWGAPPGGRR